MSDPTRHLDRPGPAAQPSALLLADQPGPRRRYALASLLSETAGAGAKPDPMTIDPAGGGILRGASCPAEGEAGHLPVHERRPVAARSVRLQAAAQRDERPGPARVRPHGPAAHRHVGQPGDAAARRLDLQVRASTARSAPGQRPAAAHRAGSSTSCASSSRCTPRRSTTTRRSRSSRPARRSPAGRSWARGSATASAARTRTCPRSSCSSPKDGPTSRSTPGSGATASCRARIRACSSAPGKDPVLYLENPDGISRCGPAQDARPPRRAATASNTTRRGDPEIQARIAQYEMAYRMQTSVPEVMDLSSEPRARFELYGPDAPAAGHVRRQLPARPPARRARRAVHPALPSRLGPSRRPARRHPPPVPTRPIRPAAALITDLKQRGLLDDTLVVWGGEFGRTNYSPGQADRHRLRPRPSPALLHHLARPAAASSRASRYGATDDFGYNVADRRRPRPRPPGDDPAPARHRPRAARRTSTRAGTIG